MLTIRDIQRQQIACLRILIAIAEQERDDAQADAEAYAVELRAARHVGVEQEKEIEALRSALSAAHAELRLARDPWAERDPVRNGRPRVIRDQPIWRADA